MKTFHVMLIRNGKTWKKDIASEKERHDHIPCRHSFYVGEFFILLIRFGENRLVFKINPVQVKKYIANNGYYDPQGCISKFFPVFKEIFSKRTGIKTFTKLVIVSPPIVMPANVNADAGIFSSFLSLMAA